MKGNLFTLGWRALGSPRRRWQVQYCVDMAEAERIAVGLVKSDGGGRWRVYGLTRVQLPDGPRQTRAGRPAGRGRRTAGNAASGRHPPPGSDGGAPFRRLLERFRGGFPWKRMKADPLRGAPPEAANAAQGRSPSDQRAPPRGAPRRPKGTDCSADHVREEDLRRAAETPDEIEDVGAPVPMVPDVMGESPDEADAQPEPEGRAAVVEWPDGTAVGNGVKGTPGHANLSERSSGRRSRVKVTRAPAGAPACSTTLATSSSRTT